MPIYLVVAQYLTYICMRGALYVYAMYHLKLKVSVLFCAIFDIHLSTCSLCVYTICVSFKIKNLCKFFAIA